MNTNTKKILAIIFWIALCLAVGGLSSVFTSSQIDTWYYLLNKPIFNPPNWLFAPVWTVLYILMGISAFLVCASGCTKDNVKKATSLFLFQLTLNFIWSFVFFEMHDLWFAFAEIIALVLAIIWTILFFYKLSKPAAYLLIPYLTWVVFASILNLSIAILN